MVYTAIDGKKKHFDSIKTARANGMKIMSRSWIHTMGIYNEDGSVNGEIETTYDYESGYAYKGYDKNGKYFYRPLYKDGSVGPNRYAKKRK